MAMTLYGSNNTYLTINNIPIENFGESDPPYTISDLEDRSVIKGGVGLSGVQLDNARTPRQLVVSVMPGSDEAAQLAQLAENRTPMFATHRIGGGTESVVMTDGVIQRRGDMGRAGKSTVTDDQWTLVFLNSVDT